MSIDYWRNSYDRLELDHGGLSGDDRKAIRAGKIRANICTRAMRVAIDGRPFDAGDPKTGRSWPPGEDIWQAYQHGLEEAAWIARWHAEQTEAKRQVQAMKDMQRQARTVLRPVVKRRAARRQARVRRVVRLAGLWSPGMARRMRRALRS